MYEPEEEKIVFSSLALATSKQTQSAACEGKKDQQITAGKKIKSCCACVMFPYSSFADCYLKLIPARRKQAKPGMSVSQLARGAV